MRILDEITKQEITDPDLDAGYTYAAKWASQEAYDTIDGVEKFALSDEDYESVHFYHAWTAEELAQRGEQEREQEHQEMMDSLPDAMAELSVSVSDNAADMADVMDAIAELSEIVSNLMEG